MRLAILYSPSCLGSLDSWLVSHLALNIGTLSHAVGCELEPRCQQTLFGPKHYIFALFHDSYWFIWFDTFICLSNLSCELWSRKWKIIFKKIISKLSWVTPRTPQRMLEILSDPIPLGNDVPLHKLTNVSLHNCTFVVVFDFRWGFVCLLSLEAGQIKSMEECYMASVVNEFTLQPVGPRSRPTEVDVFMLNW